MIIPVWNEKRAIAARLENALSLDYPAVVAKRMIASIRFEQLPFTNMAAKKTRFGWNRRPDDEGMTT
ncbi:hypothetical protein L0337_10850 [candidate division KSB1 bacterium]|nr:hypothetical protein [candidate division KSB1 bacterium]